MPQGDFAKVFGSGPEQVVAIRREGDDGPEVRLLFRPGLDWTDVCETGLGFHTAKKADKAFCDLTAEKCQEHLAAVRRELAEMTGR